VYVQTQILQTSPVDTPLSPEQVAEMPTEVKEWARLAAAFKEEGNGAYKEHQFAEAAVLYTPAIQVTPKRTGLLQQPWCLSNSSSRTMMKRSPELRQGP
ncbi:hypothetical protein C0991_009707, partial [Blastosporella zonata]